MMGLKAQLGPRGWMGPEAEAMSKVAHYVCDNYFDRAVAEPTCSVRFNESRLHDKKMKLKQCYAKHVMYVQSVVAKEDLLVWNLKDGWAPLCKFLDKPIPDGPIPHDNITGDTKFIEQMMKVSI